MLPLVDKGINKLRQGGLLQFLYAGVNYAGWYLPVWNTVTSRRPFGTNIFEREWDLLVILDACRVDSLERLSSSIRWLNGNEAIRSVGSMSAEWMLNTFSKQYEEKIAETAFISGNIWSHRIFNEKFHSHRNHNFDVFHDGFPSWNPVSANEFGYYEMVYPFANQDMRLHPEAEHIPHVITDRTINAGRTQDWNRLIVHYTLPHLNHIAGALDWDSGETKQKELITGEIPVTRELRPEEKSFSAVHEGQASIRTVRENFMENLNLALEYVEILLQNIDAEKVVLSADHGENLGDNGDWGHPFGYPFSPVKMVPWVTTTACDEETYRSKFPKLRRTPTQSELMDHLEAMGYY